MDPLRVASAQYRIRPIASWREFADQAESVVRTSADYGCKLVVLPEYFTLQLLSLADPSVPSPRAVRELSRFVPQFVELFTGFARKYKIHVVAGSIPAKGASGGIVNDSYLFSPNGKNGVQTKLHLTRFEAEDWKMAAGSKLRVFDTDIGKLCIAICYDVEFPEIVRAAARAGAQLLAVPSCTDNRQGWVRVRACAQARAIENQLFAVHSSLIGGLPTIPAAHLHYGTSAILTPSDYPFARDGVLAEGTPNDETIVIGDVSLKSLAQHRKDGSVLTLRDSARSAALARSVKVVSL